MQKNLLALTLTSVLMTFVNVSQAAEAQLYGRVDTALLFQDVKSADHATMKLENAASRLGLNIKETLTPDLSVHAYLETGFNSDDGSFSNTSGGSKTGTTMLFDRRSILSMKSKTYGELGFGRMGTVRSTMAPFGVGLGSLDPFETAYSMDCSISGVFGNDARGNNSITWLSPKWAGWTVGTTFSLATVGQEDEHTGNNDRQLAGLASYDKGPFRFVFGATHQWFGEVDEAKQLVKNYDRKNAQAYTLGATWQIEPNLKLFSAFQYHKNWRAVGGWNIDKWYAKNPDDAKNGIDGTTALVGLQYWPTQNIRLITDYLFFDGEHQMSDGSQIDAKRHVINGAAEYYLSKTTRLYWSLSYSHGSGALGSDETYNHFKSSQNDVNRITSYLGMQVRF